MNDTTFQGNGKIAYVPVVVNTKPPKPTNADRIRSMSNDELAQFLYDCTDLPRLEWWKEWVKQSDWEWSE